MSQPPDWSTLLRDADPGLRWVHIAGHAFAPDDPFGEERLTLSADGALRLDWQQRGERASWTARVPPALVRSLFVTTADTGFPEIPMAPISPGAGGARDLTLLWGEHRADAIIGRRLEEQPSFKRIAQVADSLCAQVRGRKFWGAEDTQGAVSDIAPKPSLG